MENKACKKVDGVIAMELVDVDGVASGACGELVEPEVSSRKQEHLYMVHAEQFRSIFPEETWLSILNQLDGEDQDNCANASPYFWELLQKQRTIFLLPKVIDIMALVFEQNYEIFKVITSEGDGNGAIAGTMNQSLNAEEWMKTVLKCRLVCSTWNTAVENCYQKPEMTGIPEYVDELHPKSKLNNLRGIQWAKSKLCAFGQPREVRQLLEHFEESHHSGVRGPPKNPFFGRYLCITIGIFPPDYFNNVNELLEKFGKEIWYLEVNILGYGATPVPDYFNLLIFRNFRRWLRLVPNLKFLQIHSKNLVVHVSSQSGKHPEKIECSPLPTFEKLEILCLKNLGTQLGSELIRKNSHVANIKINETDFDQDVENSLDMPNLEGFSVVDSPSGEKMLENFGPNWRNVKKLCFGHGYKISSDWDFIPIPVGIGIGAPDAFAIFQHNWAETLTDLQLEHPFGFDEETILEQSKTLRLNLHGVRGLTLCVFDWLFLDFARPLIHSLEHLVFQFEVGHPFRQEYRQRVKSEHVIQLVGFEDRMQMSNIWNSFDKLKTIKVEYIGNFDFTLFTKEKEKLNYSSKSDSFMPM